MLRNYFSLQALWAYANNTIGAKAALKLTIPQNIPLIRKEDVDRLVAGQNIRLVR